MSVAEQLEHVRGEIRLACGRSGRNPEEVTLIAVSTASWAEGSRVAAFNSSMRRST